VDYDLRRKMLDEVKHLDPCAGAALAMKGFEDGLPKLWTIHRALRLRRERPRSFGAAAAYTPIYAQGAKANHALAYMRGADVITIVPRLTLKARGWDDTAVALPAGNWTNFLTGHTVSAGATRVETLFQDFPVALLVRGNA
ncbi:MAG TPA: hypothetical protein VJU82_18565, partial [Acidobacteriaceae bacterium]|nr:hypothetical protein [Acidobacteriaceae bacterium]